MTTPQTPALAAAGASSSSIPTPKYKVFLSFGEDTSKSFSDHLCKGMVQKGIDTFWGYEKIEKGETIDTQRFKAIEESRFAIVVFSREYPSSAERLDELVKIAEMNLEGVFPVFYDVEPSEVRKQKGTFGDAFALLLKRQDFNVQKVNRWRKVLTEMANLAGWDLKNKRTQPCRLPWPRRSFADLLVNLCQLPSYSLLIASHLSGCCCFYVLGRRSDVMKKLCNKEEEAKK